MSNFWQRTLDATLARLIRQGCLTVEWPDGGKSTYNGSPRLEAHMRLTDPVIVRRLCLQPELSLGEGYTEGLIETDDLFALQCLLFINYDITLLPRWVQAMTKGQMALKSVIQKNTPHSSRRNAAHSYDLTDELFALFLDEDRQYTCAYFYKDGLTLEDAQIAKRHHIARKLLIEPGMKVLDIGCGWGGMGRTLARDYGADVTGITLSVNQAAYANDRAKAEGLGDKARYELLDYRKMRGNFDRIVTVGMLEHVGVTQFRDYFGQVKKLLNTGGVALTHCVMRNTPPALPSAWMLKYIFPGGYAPAVSEVLPVMEKEGLKITDMEIWRGHYAKTIHEWRMRTEANAKRITQMYDARFLRMWRYYLSGTEAVFYYGNQCNFQLQMAHDMADVPATRDYISDPANRQFIPLPY
ncbi:cyclopropane-fatty-acyl-phospholipid synthase family protein [Yoonia sp. 208BN28-4]|uniref:cyclopropane-fatty-acyl-phospholipid synthase family protein n=1 Tax=Yoonia sp. 208BN28-4 TaxID=3126505 RepID=UPI0030B19CB7